MFPDHCQFSMMPSGVVASWIVQLKFAGTKFVLVVVKRRGACRPSLPSCRIDVRFCYIPFSIAIGGYPAC
jgi:hypothetical protein